MSNENEMNATVTVTEYYTLVNEGEEGSVRTSFGDYVAKKPYDAADIERIYQQAMQYLVEVHEVYDHDDMGKERSDHYFSPLPSAIVVKEGNFYGYMMRQDYYNTVYGDSGAQYTDNDVMIKTDGERRMLYASELSRSSTYQYASLIKK